MNQSIKFLKEIDQFSKQKIPEKVLFRARRALLDYIAVSFAGAKFNEHRLNKYLDFFQPELGKFNAVGMKQNFVLKETVFFNGLNSHTLDFDDGTNSGIIHLGAPIFSVLIPLGQKYNKNLDDLIKAAIIGYEVSYTLAVSIQPIHKKMGYHATGTCGIVGATLAAAYMLDFSEKEKFNSFAAASLAASGMLQALDDGSELKPYNVAKTSLLCLTALQMGKSGFNGPVDPLGGRGFYKMMTGTSSVELKPLLLNGSYAIMKSYIKPYASCRYTHPSIEAIIKIRNKHKINLEDIKRIEIKTYDLAVSGHDHADIESSYSAKMSIPYSVAVGFVYGKVGLQEFNEEVLNNKEIQALTSKVYVVADDKISKDFPKTQSAILKLETKNKTFIERVDSPKGEPENPLSLSEFKDKFDMLMQFADVSEDMIESIFDTVMSCNLSVIKLIKLINGR